ncbi:MAG TPA: hypothetical protein VG013_29750 [Gemmataceae bacterium]|jgi:hypothetical protein|nr:hypothetical protein [Gemmataceae bacterium]
MQTVNFLCGHCHNLMAVGTDNLGQQVRCPHCQQVVTAPAAEVPAAVPGAAAPAPAEPSPAEKESIFAPPEAASDDLFGGPAQLPVVEVPRPSWPNFQIDSAAAPAPPGEPVGASAEPAPSATPAQDAFFGATNAAAAPTATFLEPASSGTDAGFSPGPDGQNAPLPGGGWPGSGDSATLTEGASELPSAAPARVVERRPPPGGLGLILVLIFLLPYSIFATAAAVYFYLKLQRTPNPFESLPDWPGDKPGATRKGQSSIIFERLKPDAPLPPTLRVALHHAITVGDLEVTPEKVREDRLIVRYEHSNRQAASLGVALFLTLLLRNVSSNDYFVPTDAAFYRRWTENDGATTKPYTFLEVGPKRFYGGALDWQLRVKRDGSGRDEDPREYIQGQENYQDVLKPGQQRRVIICTDQDRELLSAVHDASGQLLWRVQLRRGLVKARDHEVSASAVIGVEFTRADVK